MQRVLSLVRRSALLLSSILFLAIVVQLPASYFSSTDITWRRDAVAWQIVIRFGGIRYMRYQDTDSDSAFIKLFNEQPFLEFRPFSFVPESILVEMRSEPWWYYQVHRRSTFDVVYLRKPLWSFLLLSGTLVASFAFTDVRHWHRKRRGRCVRCGYDLRASPTACPECGKIQQNNSCETNPIA